MLQNQDPLPTEGERRRRAKEGEMYNDYMVLRLGQERARELYREAEEAGLTQRRRREQRLPGRARIGLAAAVVTLAVVILGIAV